MNHGECPYPRALFFCENILCFCSFCGILYSICELESLPIDKVHYEEF